MKLFLSLIFTCYLSFNLQGQWAIIGPATPANDWTTDTYMSQNPGNNEEWNITIYLTADLMKFRRDGMWAINGSSSNFPSGIAIQDGADILVATAGNYHISFNQVTRAYSFTFLSSANPSVEVIGDLTLSGEMLPNGVSGVNGAVLTNNGNGTMSWVAPPVMLTIEEIKELVSESVDQELKKLVKVKNIANPNKYLIANDFLILESRTELDDSCLKIYKYDEGNWIFKQTIGEAVGTSKKNVLASWDLIDKELILNWTEESNSQIQIKQVFHIISDMWTQK